MTTKEYESYYVPSHSHWPIVGAVALFMIAFGAGKHFCLGVWLARLEGKIAIAALVKRFPNMQLAVPEQQLRWRAGHTSALRGLESLPVELSPKLK